VKIDQCLHSFFDNYLPNIKGVSRNTIKAYRDTFSLFLPYTAKRLKCEIADINIEHVSVQIILDFLDYLEMERKNSARTRGHRLAVFKSLARMIRFLYPEYIGLADRILAIPQKRFQKTLVGFLTNEEITAILGIIDIKKAEGFRDYTILHLLYDSGARAEEIASLRLDYLDVPNHALSIIGKGNRYRRIELWPKTVQLLSMYIKKYRPAPKPLYQQILFINQRRQGFTRHGINHLCKKHITAAIAENRRSKLNPVHCFRHSCAINMLASGYSITDIKNHLGHENLQSTMIYLQLDISKKRNLQKKFIEYTQNQAKDSKIEQLEAWESEQETLTWLDSL
jgi:site-specific recombinase XerD